MKTLTKKQLASLATTLPEWKLASSDSKLQRTFTFDTFITALAFAAKVAVHAEVVAHHPELTITYGKVKVTLTTNELKALTAKDVELAKRIDTLSEKF